LIESFWPKSSSSAQRHRNFSFQPFGPTYREGNSLVTHARVAASRYDKASEEAAPKGGWRSIRQPLSYEDAAKEKYTYCGILKRHFAETDSGARTHSIPGRFRKTDSRPAGRTKIRLRVD
jgi:hypothetical protein